MPFLRHVVSSREEFAVGEDMVVLSFKNPWPSGKNGLGRVSVEVGRLPLDDHVSPGENRWLDGEGEWWEEERNVQEVILTR